MTLFDAGAATGLSGSYELRLGEDRFRAKVANGRFDVARGSPHQPDAIIETDPGTLSAVLWHDHPLTEALRSGDVKIEGTRPAVRRFLGLFPPPDPAPVAGA